jgi:hypothetical protein
MKAQLLCSSVIISIKAAEIVQDGMSFRTPPSDLFSFSKQPRITLLASAYGFLESLTMNSSKQKATRTVSSCPVRTLPDSDIGSSLSTEFIARKSDEINKKRKVGEDSVFG